MHNHGIAFPTPEEAADWIVGQLTAAGIDLVPRDENHKATVERCELAAYSEPDYVIHGGEKDANGITKPGSIYDQGRYDARLAIRSLIKEDGANG
jgi:hypothetical protein